MGFPELLGISYTRHPFFRSREQRRFPTNLGMCVKAIVRHLQSMQRHLAYSPGGSCKAVGPTVGLARVGVSLNRSCILSRV